MGSIIFGGKKLWKSRVVQKSKVRTFAQHGSDGYEGYEICKLFTVYT